MWLYTYKNYITYDGRKEHGWMPLVGFLHVDDEFNLNVHIHEASGLAKIPTKI